GGFPWLWSHLTNYGGNIGLHGRLDAIAKGSVEARNDADAVVSMCGTSATPEGIEVNPVVFDLGNEMRWRSESPDMNQWMANYAQRRYGVDDSNLQDAWLLFYRTAYGTYEGHRRPSESVFCALPSLKGRKITASAWSQCKIFYDPALYASGVELFLQSAGRLADSETYRYDAVDLVRQYLADLGREAYYNFVDAYTAKDTAKFDYWSNRFLNLMADQDALLSTHNRFFVGRWIDMARSCSTDPQIQDLYEHNARMLIGTWTENESAVRDYAHKEWGGMIRDYYLPRWTNYVVYLKALLQGKKVEAPDSYPAEKAWVNAHNTYRLTPEAHPVQTAKQLFEKYNEK
ncbi:MAG: alpha-N-acetylglucosaminidase C-terminal domain-containing protein, partial [Bacteroides sp.]